MTPFVQDADFTLLVGDAREALGTLDADSVDCVVTSPPYYALRDYGVAGQMGAEESPAAYVASLVSVFAEVRRVLKPTGTVWLNLGDSYSTKQNSGTGWDSSTLTKPGGRARKIQVAQEASMATSRMRYDVPEKNLLLMPARVALALQTDGWWVRQDNIWSKPNALPESATDRPSLAHEHVFLLTKNSRYTYDAAAVKEPAKWERWGDQTTPKNNPGRASFIKPRGKQELLAEHAPGSASRTVVGFNARWDESIANGDVAPDRNLRSVWEIPTEPNTWAACIDCDAVFDRSVSAENHETATGHKLAPHFAAFPKKLARTCILAGCPAEGLVIDPFAGSGTTLLEARRLDRRCIGIELRPAYGRLIAARMAQLSLLAEPAA